MLNNQRLKNKHIEYTPYDLQIGIFNAKCKGCPYAIYRVRRKTGFIISYTDFREAVAYATDNRAPLHRFCTFGEEDITLTEIVHNHCVFWDVPVKDPEEDTEVREITEDSVTQILHLIDTLKNFVKSKE